MSQRGKVYLGDVAQGRENNFNLIRACAASGVIFSHAFTVALGPEAIEPLGITMRASLGSICVLIFFATSGFFITASFDRKTSLGGFLLARVLRLFPALVLMACVMYPLMGLIVHAGEAYWALMPQKIVAIVTLFPKWFPMPGLFENTPFPLSENASLWTLKFEVLCYLGVVLFGVLGILRSKWATLVVLIAVVVLKLLYEHWILDRTSVHFYLERLARLGLPFALGAAAYVFRDRVRLDWRITAALWLVTALSFDSMLYRTFLSLALAYSALWLGYLKVPALLPFNRIGDYSYGIYIYAFPIQQLLVHEGLATTPIMNALLSFLCTLPLAIVSWHLIERPCLSLRHYRKRAQARATRGQIGGVPARQASVVKQVDQVER